MPIRAFRELMRRLSRERAPRSRRAPRRLHFESLEPRLLFSFSPTGLEQEMLEHLNRMRLEPAAELTILTSSVAGTPAQSANADIDSALDFFNVSGPTLASQWATLAPAQPLAWNEALINAATAHSQKMIDADLQSHRVPGEADLGPRIQAAGYTSPGFGLGENIFAFSKSPFEGHAAFAIDWGGSAATGGIQSPPGHRLNMMDADFREVGISIIPETDPGVHIASGQEVGPLVITQDFGFRSNQGDPYLLGVVYRDADEDAFYDAGEGLGAVNIHIDGALDFDTTSMTAGGWQVQVPAGMYTVTFSGGTLAAPVIASNVEVETDTNEKVDHRASAIPVPDIAVRGNTVLIVDGDTTPALADHTSFGSVDIGGSFVDRTFTIQNTGPGDLVLTTPFTVAGAHAGDFVVGLPGETTVTPGGSTTFTVRFDPSATGTRSATIVIESNDPNEDPFNFAINGTGTAVPEIDVLGNGTSIVDGDVTPSVDDLTDFGTTEVVGGTVQRTFSISNLGSAVLNLTSSPRVQIVGANAGDFSVVTQPGSPIGAGAPPTDFVIRFDPSAAGTRTATVRIMSNDTNEALYDFATRGFAVAPEIDVTGNALSIVDGDTTPRREDFTDFGPFVVNGLPGASAVSRTFTIRNTGDAPLTLGAPQFTSVTSDFTLTAAPAGSVAVGESTTFTVAFDPSAAGLRSAKISFTTNDPSESVYDFSLVGTGLDRTPLAGGLVVATTKTGTGSGAINGQNLTVNYTGTLLNGTKFDSSLNPGRTPFSFLLGSGSVIDGWEQGLLSAKVGERRVLFIPPALGYGSAGSPPSIPGDSNLIFEVDVLAITAPDIVVRSATNVLLVDGDTTPSVIDTTDFSSRGVGQTGLTRTFKITNSGTATLSLTGTPRVQVGGANAADFSVTQPIQPNPAIPELTFTVAFQPTAFGLRQATITIPNNDPDEGPFNFTVQGRGLPGLSVAAVDNVASEIANPGTVAFTRTGPTDAPLTVAFTLGGTALLSDYALGVTDGTLGAINPTTRSGTLTINAGAATAVLTITPGDDTLVEGNEVAAVTLVTGATYALDPLPANRTATILILDSEPLVGVAALEPDAAETVTGDPVDTGTFRISRTGPTAAPLTVNFTVAGTAMRSATGDYVLKVGATTLTGTSVTIPAGEASVDVTVNPVDNGLPEPTETVMLTVAAAPTYTRVATPATVTIADDEPTVSVAAFDASASETPADPADPGTFRISRTGLTTAPLTVNFAVAGTALRGAAADYVLKVGDTTLTGTTVTILEGESFVDVTVNPVDNALPEPTETVMLTVAAAPTYTRVATPATITIADDEPTVSVTAPDASASETLGADPANPGTFRISRTGLTTNPLTVNFAVAGTAIRGATADYVLKIGDTTLPGTTVTIAPGQAFVDVTVTPVDNAVVESIETVILTVGAAPTYTRNATPATVTIADDEPTVSVTAPDAAAAETAGADPANPGSLRISRTGSTTAPLTVTFGLSGSATRGATGDYLLAVGDATFTTMTVVIPAGQTFVDVAVNPVDNAVREAASETLTFTLVAKAHYRLAALLAARSAAVTIADND